MIRLLTAPPGNGKTSHMINVIKESIEQGKTVYTCGIPELDLAVIPVTKQLIVNWYEAEQDVTHLIDLAKTIQQKIETGGDIYDVAADDITTVPLKYFPPNSVIIVDECQFVFGKLGTAIPMHILMLSVHRHFGIDFYLSTQHPRMIHDYAKSFVSIHYSIRKKWNGQKIDEFSTVQEKPDSEASIKNAVTKKYKLDKTTFKHYRSSSFHIKQKYSVPIAYYLFIAVFVAAAVQTYRVVNRVDNRYTKDGLDEQLHAKAKTEKERLKANHEKVSSGIKFCLQTDLYCTCYSSDNKVIRTKPKTCDRFMSDGYVHL